VLAGEPRVLNIWFLAKRAADLREDVGVACVGRTVG
jgi:hypothetical protein